MRRQRVDYSGFRLSRVKEPQFRHVLLFGTWIIYFILFLLTENLIPPERCHIMHCAVDDMIPFNEYFLIFYTGWYLLVAGSLAYYFLYDVQRFKELDLYIFVTQVVAMAVYIVYPSIQDLRPTEFARDNFFTHLAQAFYHFDTNTNVCPSLHVIGSMAVVLVLALLYALLLSASVAPTLFLAVCLVLLVIVCVLMWRYLGHGGSARFAALQAD